MADASRLRQLLEAAAAAMEQGEDPFHVSFLSAHEVALDEAYDLAETLAQAARVWLAAQQHPGLMVAMLLALDGDPDLIDAAAQAWAQQVSRRQIDSVLERLRAAR